MRSGISIFLVLAGAMLVPASSALALDRTPPAADVDANTGARCVGKQPRVIFRVIDSSPTKAVVRIDGRVVKRSTRKRFTLRPKLDRSAHEIRTVVRDRAGNRLTYTLHVLACV